MKKIFVIDWILIPVFILSAYTGIELHVAGHGNDHDTWHNWAVSHVIMSMLFFSCCCYHVKTHWKWYESLVVNGLGKKSRVTLAVSTLFIILSFSGLTLVITEGANSTLGLWHYKMGLLATILFTVHVIKRIPILYKTIKWFKSI